MNGIEIIEATRKEHALINSFKFTPDVKRFLLSTLINSIEGLITETDISGAVEFSKSADLIHLAISKSFNVYACFFYFTLTGRHKILKPIPHVEGDEMVNTYNKSLVLFGFMSKKEIRRYIYKVIGKNLSE